MIHFELSVRRVGDDFIYFGRDPEGLDIPPDIGEGGRRRILGIITDREKKRIAEAVLARLALLAGGDAARFPDLYTVTGRMGVDGQIEFRGWVYDGTATSDWGQVADVWAFARANAP